MKKNIPKHWWDDPKLKAEYDRRKAIRLEKLKQIIREKFEEKYFGKKP